MSNLHSVFFISRNKDNTHLPNFKQRSMSYVENYPDREDSIMKKFQQFVEAGQKGEVSRLYISVNPRDKQKTHKALQHFLIDNPNFDLSQIESKVASLASKTENAAGKKVLFDFDVNSQAKVNEFVNDLVERGLKRDEIEVHSTKSGFAVVCQRGVDLRGLTHLSDQDYSPKWSQDEVEFKRDASLLVKYATN